jgi:hypothetical protein
MLFGQVDGYCERHGYRSPEVEDTDTHPAKASLGLPRARTLPAQPLRPPDLVIQDELHLISGPLGTLVGLYETAVDQLASWQVDGVSVRPKVIASTATVRRAAGQVHSLFLRRVEIFPPPGLDADDNFFATQALPSEAHPGRRYLGIYAPGVRHKTALIRTYTAYLAAAQKLYLGYGRDADPWMTLVGYFNALRELGGMRRAVDDSISARLHRMDRRGLARRFLSPYAVKELTSRLSASDIPAILDRLETPFDAAAEAARRQSKREDSGRFPIDVLLATNMISVGVDVSRLGLMVVAGQPKTTAEYIQATSRVGRHFPGLVCTVYNWSRPRDISHYERFGHYHATFYQNIEALSVTPFSAGAINRGLSAVLASLVRLQSLRYNDNAAAGRFDRHDPLVQAAVEQIAWRAGQLGGNDAEALVRAALASRLDKWQAQASAGSGARLGYQTQRDGATLGLLQAPEEGPWQTFTCLNSLRDVEPTVNLILDDYGMERDEARVWQGGAAPPSPGTAPAEEVEQ